LYTSDTARLTIADNGVGFDPGMVKPDQIGLRIMRERAESIGAEFKVASQPGEGTQISIIWQGTGPSQG
jgi:signal transduction histidine kinase